MNETSIILTFLAGLAIALILGYFAKRLKISSIIGYLLAGIVVGPFTPGFSANYAVANEFAEIGVILLLFGIGLRFHLKELIAVWTIALPGALLQSAISTMLAAALLHFFGWSWISGIILGAAISVASTVVMALVLNDNHDLYSPIGHIAIGWTVVEDILTVLLLLLLPILFGGQAAGDANLGSVLGIAALKILLLIPVMIALSRWVIPWVFKKIELSQSNELFTLAVIVIAVGIAVASNFLFGVSMALGAFLAGLAVGRSDYALRAAGDSLPIKDIFSVLFFVAVGMLVNPKTIIEIPILIGLVLFVVVFIKPAVAILLVRLLGKPLNLAIPIGAAFSQIGEFSFILGAVARSLNLIDDIGWNILVVVSIVSIIPNPLLYKIAANVSKKINRISLPDNKNLDRIDPKHCIIVGYGPVGKIVHQLLAEKSLSITIIELNLETVRKLRNHGYSAIYGDVLRQGVLEEAGISTAGTLILSADIKDSLEIITQAKKHNPQIKTFVRCANLFDALKLKIAGASVVASGEAEVGVAFSEAIFNESSPNGMIDPGKRIALRNRLYEIFEQDGKSKLEKEKYNKTMIFSAGLSNGIIITDLKARTKDKALEELVKKSSTLPAIKNGEEFYRRVLEREEIANTYIDQGIAIPHARTNAVSGIIISIAVSQKGVDWNSSDGKPVNIVVLVGAQKSYNEQYLQLLSRIASVFNNPKILAEIKNCSSSNKLLSIIQEREKQILS